MMVVFLKQMGTSARRRERLKILVNTSTSWSRRDLSAWLGTLSGSIAFLGLTLRKTEEVTEARGMFGAVGAGVATLVKVMFHLLNGFILLLRRVQLLSKPFSLHHLLLCFLQLRRAQHAKICATYGLECTEVVIEEWLRTHQFSREKV
eukprot:g30608.t1